MASQEVKILEDFLLTPAPLRDFITLREFTDIFPRAHRGNPAVQDIYRELQRLRDKDIELARRDIAEEVRRSKQLRREYARERRQVDDANVAGLDPIALQMEEEVSFTMTLEMLSLAYTVGSYPARVVRNRIRYRPSTPTSRKLARVSRHRLRK